MEQLELNLAMAIKMSTPDAKEKADNHEIVKKAKSFFRQLDDDKLGFFGCNRILEQYASKLTLNKILTTKNFCSGGIWK